MTVNKGSKVEDMRSQWTELYSKTLPALARARDPAQTKWPVTLDHCFARIVLDNTVGRGALQWDNVIKRPAVKNMDESQLAEAIALGEKIRDGKVDLVELDQQSLRVRGKGEKKYKTLRSEPKKESAISDDSASTPTTSKKHPRDEEDKEDLDNSKTEEKGTDNHNAHPSKQKKTSTVTSPKNKQSTLPFSNPTTSNDKLNPNQNPNLPHLLSKISTHPTLTPFRKRLYSTLLSVPPGHFTTYAAMATCLSSSARAVGNGMRNNPFAPEVPCHRVLASDGSIGGFFGDWGEEGKYAQEKRDLLRGEGVKFDTKGKVKGRSWDGLRDLSTEVREEKVAC